jgi:hypothetical protein
MNTHQPAGCTCQVHETTQDGETTIYVNPDPACEDASHVY